MAKPKVSWEYQYEQKKAKQEAARVEDEPELTEETESNNSESEETEEELEEENSEKEYSEEEDEEENSNSASTEMNWLTGGNDETKQ